MGAPSARNVVALVAPSTAIAGPVSAKAAAAPAAIKRKFMTKPPWAPVAVHRATSAHPLSDGPIFKVGAVHYGRDVSATITSRSLDTAPAESQHAGRGPVDTHRSNILSQVTLRTVRTVGIPTVSA